MVKGYGQGLELGLAFRRIGTEPSRKQLDAI